MIESKRILQAKRNYYKPTPAKWRKIGDVIQDTGLIIGSIAIFFTAPWVPVVALVVGRIGKIITNLATE